ncbi:sensor histidine kinase [Blautia schinkii]|nr:sensor histidine kinase [Blautia schinkii]
MGKKEKGIKNKALTKITILIVVSMVIAVAFSIVILRSRIIKEQLSNSRENLSNVTSYLDTYIEEIDAIAKNVNYNYALQNYLVAAVENQEKYNQPSRIKKMREYKMSSQAFNDLLLMRTDISSIMVFGQENLLFYKTIYNYWNVVMDYSGLDWYAKAVENPQSVIVTGPNRHAFLENNNEQTISLSRVIQNYKDGSFLGVILLDLNLNKIAEICESSQGNPESFVCVLNDKGELIYQQKKGQQKISLAEEDTLTTVNQALSGTSDDNLRMKLNGVDYLVTKKNMDGTQWTALSVLPYSAITARLKDPSVLIVFSVGLTLILTLLALNRVLTNIVKPIKSLEQHITQVSFENMDEKVSIESDDEIGNLEQSFNEMMERIKNLNEQMVQEQEEKRKYELQALQAQINPHFLYNTLDSIIWMAETHDTNIVPMTEALAKLFRISLNKGNEEITVKKEMEHVKNYLIIQSMRYADKLTYDLIVEKDVEKCVIIKLILQPIVENCIYHGIKQKKGKGNIIIHTFREDGILKIQVKDDGCGMSMDMCEKILSGEAPMENISGSGIGVRNVNERIKLRFGNDYGLRYTSEVGVGTTVEYTLPYILEEGRS